MPTMPSLPSRRLKLWPGKSSKEGTTADEQDAASTSDRQAQTQDEEDESGRQAAAAPGPERQKEKEEEGRPLAKDIKARRIANERLYTAAECFHSYLSKKKPLPFELARPAALDTAVTLDEASETCASAYPSSSELVRQAASQGSLNLTRNKDKLLPIEALGIAMASSASTFSKAGRAEANEGPSLARNESYASHLAHLAAVHLALGQAQSAFTETLSATMLTRLARLQATIESLRTAEKQCEAAREKMETADKRRDKARDKGENKRELEEESRLARATYEDAEADVETRVSTFTDMEQVGSGSGVEIMKEYISLHLDWVSTQQQILSGALTALDRFQDAPNTIRTTSTKKAPPIPKRWERQTSSSTSVNRERSSSSPKLPRPAMNSKATSVRTSESRPSSRGSGTISSKADRPTLAHTVGRSGSFSSGVADKISRTRGDSISKFGGRLTSVLGRSSSSNELPKAASVQKHESGSSNEGSKTSAWTSSLLTLKRDPMSRPYKAVAGEREDSMLQHGRDLSHVREGTDQSWDANQDMQEGVSLGADHRRPSAGLDAHDLGPQVGHASHDDGAAMFTAASSREASDSVQRSEPAEGSIVPASSLGVQWTGFTSASSEGGDPFGGSSDVEPGSPPRPLLYNNVALSGK